MISRVVATVLAAFLSMPVLGGGVVHAKVVKVRIDASGHGMVFFDQQVSGSLGCVSAEYKTALAFNNDAAGKAIMAAALAAKAMGSLMLVYGSGSCNFYGGWVEDWSHGTVE